jgi:hypothetical protein
MPLIKRWVHKGGKGLKKQKAGESASECLLCQEREESRGEEGYHGRRRSVRERGKRGKAPQRSLSVTSIKKVNINY